MKAHEWEEGVERFAGLAQLAELRLRRGWVLIGHASTPGRTDRRLQLARVERMIVEASKYVLESVQQLHALNEGDPKHSFLKLDDQRDQAAQLGHDFDELANAWRRHIGHPVKAIECSCVQPTPGNIDPSCDADHGASKEGAA